MRDARHAAAREQAHALPRLERFIGILRDRTQFAVIESHGDLQAGLLAHAALDGLTGHGAEQTTHDARGDRAPAATNGAAANGAKCAAAGNPRMPGSPLLLSIVTGRTDSTVPMRTTCSRCAWRLL